MYHQMGGAEGELMLAPGNRKKRADGSPEDWTRVRKDNHVCIIVAIVLGFQVLR